AVRRFRTDAYSKIRSEGEIDDCGSSREDRTGEQADDVASPFHARCFAEFHSHQSTVRYSRRRAGRNSRAVTESGPALHRGAATSTASYHPNCSVRKGHAGEIAKRIQLTSDVKRAVSGGPSGTSSESEVVQLRRSRYNGEERQF